MSDIRGKKLGCGKKEEKKKSTPVTHTPSFSECTKSYSNVDIATEITIFFIEYFHKCLI